MTRHPLHKPHVRWSPLMITLFAALVGPLAYFSGASLSGVGLGLGFVSFAIAAYLRVYVEPSPPFSRLAMGIFLAFALGFGFLGSPELFDPPFHGVGVRGVAIAALALALAVTWLLFVHAADAKNTTIENDNEIDPEQQSQKSK